MELNSRKVSSQSPCPTWCSLYDILEKILRFLQKEVDRLKQNGEYNQAAEINEGRVEIEEIRTRAHKAQFAKQESDRTD